MRITYILKAPRRTRRLAHIVRKAAAHGLGFAVSRLGIQRYMPGWARVRLHMEELVDPADVPAQFARLLEELGPTFVKFGQMLSSRPDLLPQEYIENLQRICHHVAPFPAEVARSTVESELRRRIEELFSEFSTEPLASGSIAQVHAARLLDGTDVVVKILRPGIGKTIEDDLAIMQILATLGERVEDFRPLRLPMLVDEFAQGIRQEQNLLTEAAHTHKFHTAFRNVPQVKTPKVYWEFTTSRVLTMERLTGIHLSELMKRPDDNALKSSTALLVLECFLRQFFEFGIFHADPHTGNILLRDDGSIALLDFGLVGRINETLRGQLGSFVIAMQNQHLELAAQVLEDIGALPADIDAEEFCSETARLLEHYYGVPLDKVDLQRGFLDVMQVIRKYGVVMPRDFALLGKALVTIGGIVRSLDPALKLPEIATPYARRLVRERLSPRAFKRALAANAYHLGMIARTAPAELRRFVDRLKKGAFELRVLHQGLDRHVMELDRIGNRLSLSIMLAAIIISSTTILTANIGPIVNVFGWKASALGILGYFFGFILGVWLVLGIFRSGRL